MIFRTITESTKNSHHYPLWQLKVNTAQYEELKNELREVYDKTGSFESIQDEAMLYMAEWYRREYDYERPSKESLFQSIGCNSKDLTAGGKALYTAALEKAKCINQTVGREVIQFVEGDQYTEWYYSLLYQGGLPLKKIVNDYNVWRKAIRNMVWKGYDFTDTGLPLTAAKSDSVRSFCDRVVEAALKRQYLAMPFYCENGEDQAYRFLTEEINEEKKNRIVGSPFDIQWKFIIDEPAQKIAINYAIDAPQRLQEDFIERHQLNDTVSFRIQVGDRIIPGPEYKKARSFSPFHYGHSYDGDSEISVLAAENGVVICSDALDLSEPHVIHQETGDGCYRLGYGRGNDDVRILFTEDWECATDHDVTTYHYLDSGVLNVIFVGNDNVELRNRNTIIIKFQSHQAPVISPC